MHVLGSCEASAQYSPINFFVNLFHSKNSNLPYCFSDLIHTEYRKLHKNNGHSPFVSPSIMRSSVGQCRNIRFRQLSASHVIITSVYTLQSTLNITITDISRYHTVQKSIVWKHFFLLFSFQFFLIYFFFFSNYSYLKVNFLGYKICLRYQWFR